MKNSKISCVRCIMNNRVDKEIRFNDKGVCHHCLRYDELLSKRVVNAEERTLALEELVNKIKRAGKGKEYDCILGVSGGVDSTYVAWLTKELGLRPLAIHLDNGWNSELAVSNIEKVLKGLDIDLITKVLDWEEFRDLQLAFLKSSTPDGEIPTDHAIFATLWKEAARNNIRFIISGMNFATESISVPNWSYGHSDWKYVKYIQSKFGLKKLKTFPHFNFFDLFWINLVKRVRTVSILNYIDYDKSSAMELLQNDLGWIYYGGKHYESIYTRFWQGYVLPRKFEIDKRYGHLSDLINSGQITRDDALEEIKKPIYPSKDLEEEDRQFVIKKLNISEEQFKSFMNEKPRSYKDFPNNHKIVARLKIIANWMRSKKLYPK